MIAGALLNERERNAAKRADRHDDERRCPPDGEKHKAGRSDGKIERALHSARPDRTIERRTEQAHDGSVRSPNRRLGDGAGAQCPPERQNAEKRKDAREKDREQRNRRADNSARGNAGDRPARLRPVRDGAESPREEEIRDESIGARGATQAPGASCRSAAIFYPPLP